MLPTTHPNLASTSRPIGLPCAHMVACCALRAVAVIMAVLVLVMVVVVVVLLLHLRATDVRHASGAVW